MEKLSSILLRSSWALFTAASLYLVWLTAKYFSGCTVCGFLEVKQDLVHSPVWRTAFFIHITGGMIALLTGPLQFVPAFRRKFMRTHRALGKAYLVSIMLLAGPSGQLMAFYAEGSWVASLGFLVMALLWIITTWRAYTSIRARDIAAHRAWMTRSYALTLAAVTLRTWVPISSYYLDIDPIWVTESSAWISWIPNLLIAEVLVRVAPQKL